MPRDALPTTSPDRGQVPVRRERSPRRERRAGPAQVILFNKPFGVVSQFSPHPVHASLAQYIRVANVYAAGRLDWDSEGLLVLTEDGALQHRICHPSSKLPKVYYAQVEGVPAPEALTQLRHGVPLKDGPSQHALVDLVDQPEWLWPREPPIRWRARIPTSWLRLQLLEGRNRQVRRMTAAVGHPTLRLIRWSIGPWQLEDLPPGQYREAASG